MEKITRFKNRERAARVVMVEDSYEKGCMHTSNILPVGYVRSLVNYRQHSDGTTLRPRDGYQPLETPVELATSAVLVPPHAVFYGVVTDADGTEYYTDIAIGFGTESGGHYSAATSWVSFKSPFDSAENIQPDWTMTGTRLIKALTYENLTLQGMQLTSLQKPLYGIHSGRLYAFVNTDGGPFRLSVLRITEDETLGWQAYFSTVAPKEPGMSEAVGTGFNMLLDQPYSFANSEIGYLDVLGIVPYTTDQTELLLSANLGEEVLFELFYRYETGVKYRVKWQYRAVDSNQWEYLIKYTDGTYQDGEPITVSFITKDPRFTMRVYIAPDDPAGEPDPIDPTYLHVMPYPLYTTGEDQVNRNGQLNYDLGTATGIASNGSCLILYGVEGAENTVFFSDLRDPSYFPFPYNTDILDDKVISVHRYLGNLLVATTSALHLLIGGPMPMQMSRVTLQENLGIADFDRHSVQVIRNLVFYRANDQFYLLTPKSNAAKPSDVSVAPISTPIQDLLSGMSPRIERVVQLLYGWDEIQDTRHIELKDLYNYTEGASVRNCFVFALGERLFEFCMVYDTMTRTWLYETLEVNHTLVPYRVSSIHSTLRYGTYLADGKLLLHKLRSVPDVKVDDFPLLAGERLYKNYQLLDTGSRDHGEYHKKRYRELQYIINNRGKELLQFLSEVSLDGANRQGYSRFISRHVTDPQSEDYGLIYMEREEIPNGEVAGQSLLDLWELDTSMFPDLDKVKIRFKISGKGYYPRLVLVSRNESDFELLSNAWVFRAMNAR